MQVPSQLNQPRYKYMFREPNEYNPAVIKSTSGFTLVGYAINALHCA
jgi:hypothetical protein